MATAYRLQSVGAALNAAANLLQPSPSAALDAQLLLAQVLGCTRGALLARGDESLPDDRQQAFHQLLQRRARGEPLAYLTGRREFWSLELAVTPAVLVPRPETELVVERALALAPTAMTGASEVADLGTGSGAIALALARERPQWRVTATDRSAAALATAIANAQALGLTDVQFLISDWFQALGGRRFSLIASNPPYIAAGDAALDDPALRHEPLAALTSGPTGLEALAVLVAGAPDHLLPAGWLVLEHGASQGPAVAELLVTQGFRHVRCHTDLAGLPRVTEAQWPSTMPSTSRAHHHDTF